jgi:hypothetical protein
VIVPKEKLPRDVVDALVTWELAIDKRVCAQIDADDGTYASREARDVATVAADRAEAAVYRAIAAAIIRGDRR